MLTFDAVLAVYSFFAGDAGAAATGARRVGDARMTSPVFEQRLGRWHASTCAMAFHAGERTAVCSWLPAAELVGIIIGGIVERLAVCVIQASGCGVAFVYNSEADICDEVQYI